MKVTTLPASELLSTTATVLNTYFAKHRNDEVLFLSSGGSSIALLDQLDSSLFGPRSTIGMLDERYSTDPDSNNFAQLMRTSFYEKALQNGAHFIDTRVLPDETIEELAARFESALREWIERTHGTIIATVGVGPDGHTSGVMPFPEDPEFFEATFDSPEHWATSYDAKDKNPEQLRITCTLPFFRMISIPILYISGENKRTALKRLLADTGTLAESPCRIWRENPRAELYTDVS